MPNAKDWQALLGEKQGDVKAALLMARVQKEYDNLLLDGLHFENGALQSHLNENILPGLALYRVLRNDGLDETAALAEIDTLYEAQYNQMKPGSKIFYPLLSKNK